MVYADNAATTKMSRTAIDAMLPYMETHYGNPSSLYRLGQEAAEALQSARETVAACLGCTPREITFTSGGSEADNQALISAARIGERKGKKHIISTAFEHHAILHTLKKLEKDAKKYLLRIVPERLTISRDQFIEELKARNVGVSVHFIALHTMSAYAKRFGYKPEDFPKAYAFSESEISLPLYSTLGVKNAEYVADAVLDVVKKYRK